ncbi:hypothetical protein LZ32DRAFT_383035 [Colletotrichum eremochloae]|nr:hypothetical protein LZ32DRAFT_383035 [Colletotrichum eremochloae]
MAGLDLLPRGRLNSPRAIVNPAGASGAGAGPQPGWHPLHPCRYRGITHHLCRRTTSHKRNATETAARRVQTQQGIAMAFPSDGRSSQAKWGLEPVAGAWNRKESSKTSHESNLCHLTRLVIACPSASTVACQAIRNKLFATSHHRLIVEKQPRRPRWPAAIRSRPFDRLLFRPPAACFFFLSLFLKLPPSLFF